MRLNDLSSGRHADTKGPNRLLQFLIILLTLLLFTWILPTSAQENKAADKPKAQETETTNQAGQSSQDDKYKSQDDKSKSQDDKSKSQDTAAPGAAPESDPENSANSDSSGGPGVPAETAPSAKNSDWEVIEVDGEEIFTIRSSLGPYSIKTRADNLRQLLNRLYREPDYAKLLQTIRAINGKQAARIVIGDQTMCFITDEDAKLAGDRSRMVTAQRDAERLKLGLIKDLEDRRPGHILMAWGFTALATMAFLLSLAALNWTFPKLYRIIRNGRGTLIQPLRIQKAELVSIETMVDLIVGLLRIVRAILVLFLLSIYVPAVLSFFPDTRALAGEIVGYMAKPIKEVAWPAFLAYLPNILLIVCVATVTYYVVSLIHFLFKEIERGNITLSGFDREWADPTYKIVRFLVITFSFVMIFPYLPGSGSPAFQQVSIFLGVLFSLGSTGAISHLVAGVFLTYTGAFRLGDRVKIADAVGDVVEKTLLATRIRTIKHEYITIPNGLVLSSHIVNYSASSGNPGLILHTSVTIGYDAPWREVHKALLAAAEITAGVVLQPAPFVLQTSLDDYYVCYELNAYTDQPEAMAVTYSNLHQNIQDKFNEAGIEIMSPRYTSVRDGNRTTIPESYLGKEYETPVFGVKMQQ